MIGLFVSVIKAILTMLLKTAALKFLHPYLLRLDAWCEKRLGIDIIKQEKRFFPTERVYETQCRQIVVRLADTVHIW